MGSLTHAISATDGLSLFVREWPGDSDGVTLLGLPGLVRTSGDFAGLAERFGAGRRVISLDYAGRGQSGRAGDVARYGPEACLRDVLDVCAALHLRRVVAVGISFGGLLAMGLAAARPGLLAGVILDDIGPEIDPSGSAFIRRFVATDPALADLEDSAAYLRALLPDLSIADAAGWRQMAALTYGPGPDGRYHPLWDTRIASLLDGPPPDLWPLFGALAPAKLLLVQGGRSNVLRGPTVDRMRGARPDMDVLTLPDIGHAPTLSEPALQAPLAAFLDRFACASRA